MAIQFSSNLLKFEDVKQQIINFLSENSDYSLTFDWTASNMTYIIDTMSYVTMLMSYQLTNISNNNFLDTTSIRKNAVSIAKNMGYRPKRVKSSILSGVITYYDPNTVFTSSSYITILANSTFISNEGYSFVNLNPITLTLSPTNNNTLTGSFIINEGNFKSFSMLGTGFPYQSFIIPSLKVEENGLNLYIKKSNLIDSTKIKWNEVKNSFNMIDSKIFFVEEDIETGFPKIKFGDGIIGAYPSNNETILVEYMECNGSLANNQYLVSLPKDINSYSVSNDINLNFELFKFQDETNLSYGGRDIETLEEIKNNAPLVLSSSGRAVTKADYINILNSYSYIYKGNVIGGEELFPNDLTKLGNIFLTGIPNINFENFLNNQILYLSAIQESNLKFDIKKFNIISTNIEFFKPSYIYIEITPEVEFKNNISVYDEIYTKNQIKTNLNNYKNINFGDFNKIFRSSKIISEIDKLDNVISSNINSKYYFIINNESLYDSNNASNNFIYLPVQVSSTDSFGNILSYSSFVQTNKEYQEITGIPVSGDKNINLRSIYGELYHPNVSRYLYNEDVYVNGEVKTASIKLFGENKFFDLYRFELNYNNNFIPEESIKKFYNGSSYNPLNVVISNSVSGSYTYDSYSISYENVKIGDIERTQNRDFSKGLVSNESEITSTVDGSFYECLNSFSTSGSNKDFNNVEKGEYIIYNSEVSGGLWKKCIFKEQISAVTDESLYTINNHNDVYMIDAGDGNFGGLLTESVSAGEYIIFNKNSTSNPVYKWEKLKRRFSSLDASLNIPPKAIEYDIKIVSNLGLGDTDFGGRTTEVFYEDDLIMYIPDSIFESDRWTKIVNISNSTEMDALDEISAASGSELELIDYHPASGVPIGKALRVKDIGSFSGSEERIIWPISNTSDFIAYVNDVLVYVGDGKWRIFSRSLNLFYVIDGLDFSSIPIELDYGYIFTVAGSGNFNGSLTLDLIDGDEIIFTDLGWIKQEFISTLDSSSSDNLPAVANQGDILEVIEDGYCMNSELIYPQGSYLSDGDYLIFTNAKWMKLRDYSFIPAQISNDINGKDILNNLGFNSRFFYKFNNESKFYEFYFNDIFHDVIVGDFRYDVLDSETNSDDRYDIGKIKFKSFVQGKYESITNTELIPFKELLSFYDSNVKLNKIRITPKNKKDIDNKLLLQPEEDLDGTFSQMFVLEIKDIVKK